MTSDRLPPSTAPARTELRVRYAETDTMGVVHHATYVIYFEAARTEFMRSRGVSYVEMESQGLFLAVVDVVVRYRARALFDDLLQVETRLTRVAGASIEFEYRIWRDEILICTGTTRLASVDRSGRAIRLEPGWRSRLEPLVEDSFGTTGP